MKTAAARKQPVQNGLSRYDEMRKKSLILTLERSRERAVETLLYLEASDRDWQECVNVKLALEHIEIALERLGVQLREG